MVNSRWLGFTGAAAALLLSAAPDAEAQWGPRVGVGYVVNAPNQYVGLSAHVLTQVMGGLGLYVDGKITRPSVRDRDNFETQWTAEYVENNFGDVPFGDLDEYTSINLALMRPITPELIAYAGAGYTDRSVYVEYLNEERERGTSGIYWVEAPDDAATGVNVLLGGFFRISRSMSLQFGIETAPRGATVGASFAVPLGR